MRAASPALITAALIAVQVLFGLNYVISKVVVTAFPPLVWASIRIIIAAVFMVGFALISRRPGSPDLRRAEDRKNFFIPLIGLSLLGMIINQASFLVGLSRTTSTNSAVLNTMIPVFTLLIVTIRGQERLTIYKFLGFVLAFAGVLSLRRIEDFSLSDQTLIGDLLTLLNCLSYGLFLSFGKTFTERHDRVWTTAWLFLYGTFGLTLIALPDYQRFVLPEFTPLLWGCMAFAVFGGTLATYFLNVWALSQTRSSSVALYIYIQPVIAAALAWVWWSEPISVRTLVSSGLIFLGMTLSLKK